MNWFLQQRISILFINKDLLEYVKSLKAEFIETKSRKVDVTGEGKWGDVGQRSSYEVNEFCRSNAKHGDYS